MITAYQCLKLDKWNVQLEFFCFSVIEVKPVNSSDKSNQSNFADQNWGA
jgi:hypothetical protein